MQEPDSGRLPRRLLAATGRAAKASALGFWHLVKVMVPASLLVAVLEWSGFLPAIAGWISPVTRLLGLPGEAVLVVFASIFFNLNGALAALWFLPFSLREATILSILCLLAHGLPVETAQMRKAGSSGTKMVFLRIFLSLASAWVYSIVLPVSMASRAFSTAPAIAPLGSGGGFLALLLAWAPACLFLVLACGLLVLALRIGLVWLEEFRIIDVLARIIAPFVPFMGLRPDMGPLWLAINLGSYSQGAAIIAGRIKDGKMKPQEGDLFNHHAAVCHALLEDSALLVVFGAPLFWITLPRLALAVLVTWIERIRRHYFRRSFRAGVA